MQFFVPRSSWEAYFDVLQVPAEQGKKNTFRRIACKVTSLWSPFTGPRAACLRNVAFVGCPRIYRPWYKGQLIVVIVVSRDPRSIPDSGRDIPLRRICGPLSSLTNIVRRPFPGQGGPKSKTRTERAANRWLSGAEVKIPWNVSHVFLPWYLIKHGSF